MGRYVTASLLLILLAQQIHFLQCEETSTERRPGYASLGDRTYWFGNDVYFSAEEVAIICNDLGMSVLSLEDQQEMRLVTDYIAANDSKWFYWLSLALHGDHWVWTGSGQRAQFFDWDVRYPSVQSTNQSRGWMFRGAVNWPNNTWRDYQGDGEFVAACEEKTPQLINLHTTTHAVRRSEVLELGTRETIGGREYWIGPNVTVTPGEGDILCNDIDMVVVSLETAQEYQLVVDFLKAQSESRGPFQNYLTSLMRYNSRWLWSGSGRIGSYLDWALGYPEQESDVTQQCGFLQGQETWGMIHDLGCTGEARLLCEQRIP